MRMKGHRKSRNVEDRRSLKSPKAVAGGGLGMLVLVIVVILLGGNPQSLLQSMQSQATQQAPPISSRSGGNAADDEQAVFVSMVLADTEDVWNELFVEQGRQYQEPTLVLFRDEVRSACGFASSATGPFYCPGDQNVYLDMSFFDDLARRFQAPGDFAQAYVIAHEVGHHVQYLLGISDQVHQLKRQLSEEEYNALSVRLELQADFFAGVWAHHAQRSRSILESGDLEEALRAASAIGDDAIQKKMQGYVVPESFTHGTSQQRISWFRHGFVTGRMELGDTFNLPDP